MAAQGQTQTAKTIESGSPNVDEIANGIAGNVDHIMKANAQASQALLENWSKIGQELMTFANSRWGCDMDAVRELSECRDPFKAFQIQTNAFQTMMTQYMDEAAKIANMATDASVSCFRSLDNGLREASQQGVSGKGRGASS
jgi:hypothetical protein